MPSFTDGEGGCFCPAGQEAGIGRPEDGWHRERVHGCLFGPKASVGVSPLERRRRALAEYVKGFTKADRPVATLAFVAGWDARGGD